MATDKNTTFQLLVEQNKQQHEQIKKLEEQLEKWQKRVLELENQQQQDKKVVDKKVVDDKASPFFKAENFIRNWVDNELNFIKEQINKASCYGIKTHICEFNNVGFEGTSEKAGLLHKQLKNMYPNTIIQWESDKENKVHDSLPTEKEVIILQLRITFFSPSHL